MLGPGAGSHGGRDSGGQARIKDIIKCKKITHRSIIRAAKKRYRCHRRGAKAKIKDITNDKRSPGRIP